MFSSGGETWEQHAYLARRDVDGDTIVVGKEIRRPLHLLDACTPEGSAMLPLLVVGSSLQASDDNSIARAGAVYVFVRSCVKRRI